MNPQSSIVAALKNQLLFHISSIEMHGPHEKKNSGNIFWLPKFSILKIVYHCENIHPQSHIISS